MQPELASLHGRSICSSQHTKIRIENQLIIYCSFLKSQSFKKSSILVILCHAKHLLSIKSKKKLKKFFCFIVVYSFLKKCAKTFEIKYGSFELVEK